MRIKRAQKFLGAVTLRNIYTKKCSEKEKTVITLLLISNIYTLYATEEYFLKCQIENIQ